MPDRLGFVVAEINQASHQSEDLSSTNLYADLADAEWERDLRTDEAAEAGRKDRYIVCEVIPVEGSEDG